MSFSISDIYGLGDILHFARIITLINKKLYTLFFKNIFLGVKKKQHYIMLFITVNFITLFVICYILYFVVKEKYRNLLLLVASCVFVGYNNWMFLVVASFISLFTYGAGRLIERTPEKRSIYLLFGAIGSLISTWISFRYATSFIFPLGISFYTFQAISYLIDIYWKDIKAEKNPIDFGVYMLFFMKFLSGPIERGADMLSQLKTPKQFDYENAVLGLKLIALGIFKKVIIANNIAPYTETMFGSIQELSGIQLLVTMLIYPIELYADFSGYTDIAIGGARMFGIRLTANFHRPFVALTTSDFWRRWHISLSSWVRDYLYNPLMFQFRSIGQWGVLMSLSITFITFGVWHGAGWTFAIYGLLQALIIFYEANVTVIRNNLHKVTGHTLANALLIIRTYLLFAVSLVFFRASSMSDAIYFLKNISISNHGSWKEASIGMPDHNWAVAGVSILLLFVFEHLNEHYDLNRSFHKLPLIVRWSCYYAFVILILLFGMFETESFIYFQF